jgi:hypothetical protein
LTSFTKMQVPVLIVPKESADPGEANSLLNSFIRLVLVCD